MTGVRVLAGTRKGAFVLTSDGRRDRWEVSGPHFAGWEVYHVKGLPADPDRLYASQCSGWSGQVIQRSDDGGATWAPVGTSSPTTALPGTHQWYDGTPHPWEFERVWHLEPSLDDPDTVWAGVEDAGLFRSRDGGQSWQEMPALRGPTPPRPGSRARAGCACTRSCSTRPRRGGCSPRSRRRARSGPMTTARAGGRSTRACSPRASRPGRRGRALRAPARDAPVPAGRAVHAEALGRHALRRRRRVLA